MNLYRARDVLTPSERACLRSRWIELRGPYNVGGRSIPAIDAVPELAPSLELLVLEGYSGDDIANMFGITPATAGGWLKAAGIASAKETRGRVWSDAHRRFVPITATMATRIGIRSTNPVAAASTDVTNIGTAQGRRPLADVCLHGHALTGTNRMADGSCRVCRRRRDREYYARRSTPL